MEVHSERINSRKRDSRLLEAMRPPPHRCTAGASRAPMSAHATARHRRPWRNSANPDPSEERSSVHAARFACDAKYASSRGVARVCQRVKGDGCAGIALVKKESSLALQWAEQHAMRMSVWLGSS